MDSKIFNIIVSLMIIAQTEKIENKKEYVLLELQKYMTKEQYERYQPFISISIDGVKYLSKSNLLKNFKNSKCCI